MANAGALNAANPVGVNFVDGGDGILQLNGISVKIRGLVNNYGSAIVQNASPTPAVLTVDKAVNTSDVFAGNIQDGPGGGSLGLTKSGLGMLSLTGSNTFSGPTTVSGGTLMGNVATFPTNISVSTGATVAFNQTNNAVFKNQISGGGGMTKTGLGTLTLKTNATYTGPTIISSRRAPTRHLRADPGHEERPERLVRRLAVDRL